MSPAPNRPASPGPGFPRTRGDKLEKEEEKSDD